MRPEPAASLLATPRRQKLLEHIWQRTSLSRRQFAALYVRPLERYAELVQQFPASESHHHAYPGGLLDHGVNAKIIDRFGGADDFLDYFIVRCRVDDGTFPD
ncbi:TraI domain-containing protein [Pluralibacter gergoviae]|uniref:TraI domain-containing protein n=1 Tax=Pluralibacter gergoviae TaxID=61647 RepID=UPI003EE1898D